MELTADSNLRPLKFYALSSLVHVVLFSLAIVVGALMPKPEIPPLTEITILEGGLPAIAVEAAGSLSKSDAAQAPPASREEISEAKKVSPNPEKDVVIIPKNKMTSTKIAKAKHPKKTLVPHQAAAKVIKSVKSKAYFQGPTVPVSEELAPVLESEDFDRVLKADMNVPMKQLDESDIAEDLAKVDKEHSAKVAALKKSIDDETNGALTEEEENLKTIQAEAAQRATVMERNATAMKAADQSRIQQALASEKASALAASQAARDAAGKAAAAHQAALAKAAGDRAAANRLAAAQAAAAEVHNRQLALGNSLGVNAPVRELSEIKQYPGNMRPIYENEDRLAGRQGEVSFLAYVTSDGKISQFKLVKSTGHRTLDARTLNAIHNWKFYPGQEGWVEIPFRWDLKGGPQELTATLRRSLSQK